MSSLELSVQDVPEEFWASKFECNSDSSSKLHQQSAIAVVGKLLEIPKTIEVLILRAKALIREGHLDIAKLILEYIKYVLPEDKTATRILESINFFNVSKFKTIDNSSEYNLVNSKDLRVWKLTDTTSCGRNGPIVTYDGSFISDGSSVDLSSCLNEVVIRDEVSSLTVDCLVPLNSSSANNFWHWCIEQLPRAYVLSSLQLDGKILVQQKSDFVVQTLTALGFKGDDIIESNPYVDINSKALYFIEHPDLSNKYEQIYLSIREKVVSYCNSKSSNQNVRPKRIYVQRKNSRTVLNEEKLLSLLSHFGFTAICFDDMPFIDQVSITSGAEIFLGPHGASFAHNLFMPNNSTVIELFSPNYVNPCMTHIHKFFNQKYHMVVAKNRARSYPHQDDIEVPLDILEVVLKSIITALPS
jgi:hypothetical protein